MNQVGEGLLPKVPEPRPSGRASTLGTCASSSASKLARKARLVACANTRPVAPSTSHSQRKFSAMPKIPHARSRDKAATEHHCANWYCNCERCRCEIDHLFDNDRAFFDTNPDRRLYCREFIEGELPPEAFKGVPAGYRPVRSHGSANPAPIKSAYVASMAGRCCCAARTRATPQSLLPSGTWASLNVSGRWDVAMTRHPAASSSTGSSSPARSPFASPKYAASRCSAGPGSDRHS